MKPKFLDEGCDVFMNENEIKMKGITKKVLKFSSF
jgi:hypothetical protein